MRLLSRHLPLIAMISLAAFVSACDTAPQGTDAKTATAAEAIQVENPRIRATPPGQPVTGAFMTLTNASGEAYALTAAHSDIAGVTELHETSMQGDMMQMQKVEKIDIPANGSVELKPGSFHVMLIQLQKPAVEGETESITLTFSDNSQTTIEAPIANIMK